jgi:hypothetical protein
VNIFKERGGSEARTPGLFVLGTLSQNTFERVAQQTKSAKAHAQRTEHQRSSCGVLLFKCNIFESLNVDSSVIRKLVVAKRPIEFLELLVLLIVYKELDRLYGVKAKHFQSLFLDRADAGGRVQN